MQIPDPTPEQQDGIDYAVEKANASIIAANAARPKDEQAPLYTSESYQVERIQQMRDSWAAAVSQETGAGLLKRALALPLEQRKPLIEQVRGYLDELPEAKK